MFGSVRKMFPKIVCRSVESETTVSLGVSVASLIALASRATKMTGRGRKEISSMTLDEARSRTYHCNDQVGRMAGEKGSPIAREGLVSLAVP